MDKEKRFEKICAYIDELTSDIPSLSNKAIDIIKNKYESDKRSLREIFIEIDDILKIYSKENKEELIEEEEGTLKNNAVPTKVIKKRLKLKTLVIVLIIIIIMILGITIGWILIR